MEVKCGQAYTEPVESYQHSYQQLWIRKTLFTVVQSKNKYIISKKKSVSNGIICTYPHNSIPCVQKLSTPQDSVYNLSKGCRKLKKGSPKLSTKANSVTRNKDYFI